MTGGYSGLGLEKVRAMSAAGAHVVVPARRRADAADVLARVDRAEVDALDLGDLDSAHAFAVQDAEQGAATPVWAATSPALVGLGGVYCEDCDIAEPTDVGSATARIRGVDAHAIDPDAAARLWTLSAQLTGVDAFTPA